MANQYLIIANPTATEYTNVNAGGSDIPAYSVGTAAAPGDPVVLTDAEQAAFAAAHKDAVIAIVSDATPDSTERENVRLGAKILSLGKLPSKVSA